MSAIEKSKSILGIDKEHKTPFSLDVFNAENPCVPCIRHHDGKSFSHIFEGKEYKALNEKNASK